MDLGFEQMVRERAYAIWMAAGQADGMAQEHWCSAEQMVKRELAPIAKTVVATASAKKPVKAKTPAKPKTTTPKKPTGSATRARRPAALAN